jgi:flagellar basal-body rod modification protein FlgD
MPLPNLNPVKNKSAEPQSEFLKNKYLETDKKVDIKNYLEKLKQEEKSGLKNIEVRDSPKQLGKDDFLKLLITQLSQQDPTNPMKDQDFIAQMAQFSSLEQMKNISSGISRMEAKQSYAIVGKLVSGPDLVTGEEVVGIAGAVFFDGSGKTYVRVNGRTVDSEKITSIADPVVLQNELEKANKETKEKLKSEQPKNNINSSENPKSTDSLNTTVEKSVEFLPKVDRAIEWNFPGVKKENNYIE